MSIRRTRSITCAAGAFLLFVLLAGADGARAQIRLSAGSSSKTAEPVRTVGPDLVALDRSQGDASREVASDGLVADDRFLRTEDAVLVEAVATGPGRSLLRALTAEGLTRAHRYGSVVSGLLPLDRIGRVAELPQVRFLRPVRRPHRAVGRVTTLGDSAMASARARRVSEVDGSGVAVGVLSTSYANGTEEGLDVGFGDLPHDVEVLFDHPAELLGAESDEGRAMMQIVHDIAPGADLLFHTASFGRLGMVRAIEALREEGADVIVDDLFYLTAPFFQDGLVSRAVDRAVDRGIAYFAAAGNQGTRGYAAPYRRSDTTIHSEVGVHRAHDFDAGPGVDVRREFRLPPGGTFRMVLQWDQPYALGGSAGSESDYDVFLLNEDGEVVESGITNSLGADPVEIVALRNTDSTPRRFSLILAKYVGESASSRLGPDAGRLQYVDVSGEAIPLDHAPDGPTLIGQAGSAGAEAVGAAFYQETPAFGVVPPRIESYSSLGGMPVLFDERGNRLAEPRVRRKPELVAPDGVNTTFFGGPPFSAVDDDFFPNFFGTSAAAPHAAAVAALMLEAGGGPGSIAPGELYAGLERAAVDMDDPGTSGFDLGFDSRTGYGLVRADSAVASSYNHAPVAVADTFGVPASSVARLEPLRNDSDPDGDSLRIAEVTAGRYGTASVSGGGWAVLYTGPAPLPGGDTLRYVVTDGFRRTSARIVLSPLPDRIVLEPNRPNPFRGDTRIRYVLPEGGRVRVQVYDPAGRRVRTLLERSQTAGPHTIRWSPSGVSSGAYLYRVELGAHTSRTGTMVLVE